MISSNDQMGGNVMMDVKTVFLNVLETETDQERQAYLDTVCANDSELREQVIRLLDAHKHARGFLDPEAFGADLLEQSPFSDASKTVIGHYRLLEKIGEGGMAVVYRAEQTQPIRRHVAIKVIKLGMDTAEVIARFEAERQALAIMDHPNIAKVLDAGVTEAGKPYFVMELVQGISITDYCDQHKSNTRQRLELFLPVCHAVHHAHHKGIIHRDLKPSNILVTMRDNEPVPKIIDFGIAKAINQRLTEKTLVTLHTQLVGTPEYMSPEQAEMHGTDIDTRTDIYSLGVVLYELMVGTSPFDTAILRRAALGEIHRIIREEEPLRPSTRISVMGAAAQDIAARRGTNVAELTKRLNRELEWIPLKAMRKDRSRRYRSALELSDDIDNYLNSRPLLAGPESTVYRFRKAAYKHRSRVLAISAVAVAVITGFVISMSLYGHVSLLEARAQVNAILSRVEHSYEEGRYQAGLEEIEASLKDVKAMRAIPDLAEKSLLMRAQLLLEVGQSERAKDELLRLTKADAQIAGTAHYLLARIYLTADFREADRHRQLAESKLPRTAETLYLQGMAAASAADALRWLGEAVDEDSKHYSARKARTLAFYGIGAYEEMVKDAGILIALHPQDYMGHALSAIAHREIGQFERALGDHAQAIKLCTLDDELIRLYQQRQVTYVRSGDYQKALEDAERVSILQEGEVRFPVLDALMPLAQYERIETEYKEVARHSNLAARFAKAGPEGYAFGRQDTEQPFVLPLDVASRSPFYYMTQAAALHQLLREKATTLPISGGSWLGDWSPDGRSIAYRQFSAFGWLSSTLEGINPSRMTSCIEILDLVSEETRLITRFGNTPIWSPDGQHIAFTDYNQDNPDIWLVSSAGGEPRKLAPGFRPQWSRDSQRVFFRSHSGTIWAVGITPQDSKAVPVLERYPGTHLQPFSISPDESLIADEDLGEIRILTFPEGEVVARWKMPWPLQIWAGQLQWHPNGETVVFNSSSYYNQMGMCLLNTERGEATHVLNVTRPWCRTIWSPDGSQLIVDPYVGEDVWLIDVDPTQSLEEALAPALTTEEFLAGLLDTWGERIEADPLYADNYVSRVVVLMAVNDYGRAEQDLDHCAALINDPNDPAVHAINHWARMYKKPERDTEAELWAQAQAQLAQKFPELNKAVELK